MLEGVHRWATKMIPGLHNLSYTDSHCLLEISATRGVVWSCRKETVNRYFKRMFLVTGLWTCGTPYLKTLYLLQL